MICKKCSQEKLANQFVWRVKKVRKKAGVIMESCYISPVCKACKNTQRRHRYATDTEYRTKVLLQNEVSANKPERKEKFKAYLRVYYSRPENRIKRNEAVKRFYKKRKLKNENLTIS